MKHASYNYAKNNVLTSIKLAKSTNGTENEMCF